MSRPLFVYGSLRDPGVRALVLGRRTDLTTRPAVLRGHVRTTVPDFDYPFVVPGRPDDRVDGDLLFGLGDADYELLDEYEEVGEGLYVRAEVQVETPGGTETAWVYLRGPAAP